MKRNFPLFVAAGVLLATGLGAAEPAVPFTIDRVLAQLQPHYPAASRVADQLPADVLAREDILYAKPDGVGLGLDIYRPVGGRTVPAVLIVHGGGWESGDRQMERPFAKQLAHRGYAAIPVSYRLGERGRFPNALYDIKAAVRWVRAHAAEQDFDPDRIGAVGGSSGGQLVALLGASNGVDALEGSSGTPGTSSSVQAVVDIDGVASFLDPSLIAQEESRPRATSRYLGGIYSQRRANWVAASATTYLSRRSAPTLFLDSTAKSPILPGREEMSARLRALGIDSQVMTIPGTPHPFWLVHPWFERVLDYADGFLRPKLSDPPRLPGNAGRP